MDTKFDVFSDNGAHLKSWLVELQGSGHGIPISIQKCAAVQRDALPPEAFAYQEGKEFPVVDKGNVAVSTRYFFHNLQKMAADLGPATVQGIAANLKTACEVHGYDVPVSLAKLAEHALPTEEPTEEVTMENVKFAMDSFADKLIKYEPANRRTVAKALLKAADEQNLTQVPEPVAWYGSDAWNPRVGEHLQYRAGLLKSAGRTEFLPVVEALRKQVGVADPEEFALALADFDKQAGLEKLYDTRLSDPWASTFGLPGPSDDKTEWFKQAVVTFSKSAAAKKHFSEDLLTRLSTDPLGTLQEEPEDIRNAVVAQLTQ